MIRRFSKSIPIIFFLLIVACVPFNVCRGMLEDTENIDNKTKYYRIILKDSNYALDAEYPAPSSNIGKSPLRSPQHKRYNLQLWRIERTDGNFFRIVLKDSNYALDAEYPAPSSNIGKSLLRSPQHKHYDLQLWRIVEAEEKEMIEAHLVEKKAPWSGMRFWSIVEVKEKETIDVEKMALIEKKEKTPCTCMIQ